MYYIIYLYIYVYIYKLQKQDTVSFALEITMTIVTQNLDHPLTLSSGTHRHKVTTYLISHTNLSSLFLNTFLLRSQVSRQRQPVSQVMHGSGTWRSSPVHCGDWCTPLVTKLELHTQCSLFVLCTQRTFKFITEVLTWHIQVYVSNCTSLFSSHSTKMSSHF